LNGQDNENYPSYLKIAKTGELKHRAETAVKQLHHCEICPRNCGIDRFTGKTGAICRTGRQAEVSAAFPHFGEEAVLTGQGGSGTIFFTGCGLGCVFCQNYDISHGQKGHSLTDEQLADAMLYLQSQGVTNINLVTPSHVMPQILSAVSIAALKGLEIPIVYNTSAYEKVETLKLLKDVVDIYMPDFKIWDANLAVKWLKAGDYPERAMQSITEMFRQVGDLKIKDNLAKRGLLVRHLVMPGTFNDSNSIFRFLAELSKDTFISILDQYRPMGQALNYPEIARKTSQEEIQESFRLAKAAGLHRFAKPGFSPE